MRSLVAMLASAVLVGPAGAQVAGVDVPFSLECKVFDGGSGSDSWWKLNNPAGDSDWFNVDFDSTCQSNAVFGLCVDVWDTFGAGDTMTLGIYPESGVFPNTPDLNNPLHELHARVEPDDGFSDLISYALPCFHLGSTDVHVAMQPRPGDSGTWLGADTLGPAFNRSFVTSTSYDTGASDGGLNWQLGLVTRPVVAAKNTFLVNGEPSVVLNSFDPYCLAFWGTQTGQRSLLFFCSGGIPMVSLGIPVAFTTTGNVFAPGPKPETWELCAPFPCGLGPAPITLCLIYQDFCDLKPNNKPKLKISNSVTMNPVQPPASCPSACYGIQDDGDHDGFCWKVTNPSGPSDWFVVNLGTASSNTAAGMGNTGVTSVEIAMNIFCGASPSVEWVGYHRMKAGTNPSVDVEPDLATGAAILNVPVPDGTTSSGCYPGTVFSLPTAVPISTGGLPYVAGIKVFSGDTCIWICSDTDGTDNKSGCGSPLPNNFSARSNDNFVTNAFPVTNHNWAIKVNWVGN